MPESIIAIIAIHEIPLPTITSILTSAYHKAVELDSPPALTLLAAPTKETLQSTSSSITYPPVTAQSTRFLNWGIRDVALFLRQNAHHRGGVDPSVFLIADKETAEGGETMLLVQTEWSQRPDGLGIDCVRIAGEDANTYAVAVSVATLDVGEVRGLVDGDGVYGCTSSDSAKKGGRAPRKQF